MKLSIDYDPYLRKEGEVIFKVVKKVFGFDVILKQKQHPELLKFNEAFGVYETQLPENLKNAIYVTGNQILSKDAKSNDDYLFGVSYPKTKTVIISLAKLKEKRKIARISVHEVGHWAVLNQDHYDDYSLSIFDQGPHCKDSKCIMYPVPSEILYKEWFCTNCQNSLMK